MTGSEDRDANGGSDGSRDEFGSAADAADAASRDAEHAAGLAANAKVEAESAAVVAVAVAVRAQDATAVAVSSAASATAKVAAGAAAAVASEAVERAFDAAVSAVKALEAVAAQLPADADREEARRAAALVATAVADEVLVQARATEDAAATVATAVTAAAQKAAVAAATAAAAVERDTVAAAAAGGVVAGSIAETAAATEIVHASTGRVADLTERLRVVALLRDSERRFNVIFQDSPLGMTLISLDTAHPGRVLQVNQRMCELTGRPEEDLLELSWLDLVHPGDRHDQVALFNSVLDGAVNLSEVEVRWVDAEDRVRWVRMRLHALREGETGPAYGVGQVEDITEWRYAQVALRAREERFRLAFQNAVTGMMFLSLDGTLIAANGALVSFLDRGESDLVGERLETLVWRDEQISLRTAIDELAGGVASGYQAEHRFICKNGAEVWGVVSGTLVDDTDGGSSYLVFQVGDVTWRKQAELRLSHQALHDGLTGLANRVLFNDRLDQARVRAKRDGTHVAVLFIDVDDFKEINDRFGHAAGDEVLVEFAERLRGTLRETDTGCRWGGDEFVVICGHLSHPNDVTLVADRVAAALDVPFSVAGTELIVTASIGITTDDGTAHSDDLLRGADMAMFQAKDSGKDRYEIYGPEMRATVQGRVSLARELAHAVADGELRLHYQPMFDMTSGAIVGFEALLRWQHPTRGLLAPVKFLDLAESHRLMIPIGDWVLATALAQAAHWQRSLGSNAPDMWINISAQQLGNCRLTATVERYLAETGLPPSKLGLEITERHLVGEAEDVRSDLLALNSRGVRLAVDDFGTGYGSFDYLRRFPIDTIKIDMSFVSGLGVDRTDTAVITAIIALGCSLDLVVVAEGVETQDQYDRLNDLGCHVSQGYLLHRPAPPETIDLLLHLRSAGADGAS